MHCPETPVFSGLMNPPPFTHCSGDACTGQLKWYDGTDFTYDDTFYRKVQPNSMKDCTFHTYSETVGKSTIDDRPCTDPLPYVCKQ